MIPRGLDRPIKDLTFDGKKFISLRLNGKGNYGYFYWQMIAEKLDLVEECKTWEGVENPTEKVAHCLRRKRRKHHQKLIAALREVELSHFANEIEQKFPLVEIKVHEDRHLQLTPKCNVQFL
ncbi:hypothetical protein OS493_013384 [Desmophyllum pertusum]|uniref:Uncharacterized protein n=1 Tax=Desmophyllum pertusum TaxID=174260 RepID=A0A9X0CFM2_9CNID|nr:hypothetical protein OS493_013384 [Desmophyllum pertusum]